MTLQTWIALLAVAAAALYLGRSAATELACSESDSRGPGGCASGCGSCGSKTCPAKRGAARRI